MTHDCLTRPSSESTADVAQSPVLWSRSGGLLSDDGNASVELKTRVCDEAGDDFRRLARRNGMSTSAFLRVLVLTRLYGVDGVVSMTAKQLAVVAGVGPETAHETTP